MSKTTVLLVGDDRQLLDAVRRSLCFDYDLHVAESGPQALDILATTPAPVVITDMRMPGMDGLQFIASARSLAPDACYLMLTGNHDLETAVNAVNVGQVFRFLNKPCGTDLIKASIEQARLHYEVAQCEKALLNKTCAGAVGMLMDVLETNQPDVGLRLVTLRETFEQLRAAVGLRPRWDLALASRLALIGLVCFDRDQTSAFLATPPNADEWGDTLRQIVRTGGRVISRIPRLDGVGRIIQRVPETDGGCYRPDASDGDDLVEMGATLLHIAALLDAARSHGLSGRQAVSEVRLALRKPRPEYLALLDRLPEPNTAVSRIEVPATELRPGMVLHDDVRASDGYILVRAGKRLSDIVIERIRERLDYGELLGPFLVVEGPGFDADAKAQPAENASESLIASR